MEDEFNEFDNFLNEEESDIEPIDKYKKEDTYVRKNTEIQDSIEALQGNINSMLDQLETPIEDMFADKDLLPNHEIKVQTFDYEKELEIIRVDSKDTLECLANLYLTEEIMQNKNIYKIIKEDSIQLGDLNFTVKCSKRALINAMKQLDFGVNDPLMYQAVALFNKEMRETIKMIYDLQKKMKDFYKELKEELGEINAGEQKVQQQDGFTIINDPKLLDELYEQYKRNKLFDS